MIGFVMIGTNDLPASSKFYDDILLPLDIVKVNSTERYTVYAKRNNPDKPELYITIPYDKKSYEWQWNNDWFVY